MRHQEWKNFKLDLSLRVEFYKETPDGAVKKIDAWFNGGCMGAVTHISLLDDVVLNMIGKMGERIGKFIRKGSGWIINKLLEFQIKVFKCQPLNASSYMPLHEKYQNPKFRLINMKNEDQECFKWCVTRYDCMVRSRNERVSRAVKGAAEKYNWEGLTFPMSLQQMDKFERQNGVSVSVYGLDGKLYLYPLRVSKINNDKHVMMLLIEDDENNHYVLMQSLSSFVDKKHHEKTYPCHFCLHSFYRKGLLEKHEHNCMFSTHEHNIPYQFVWSWQRVLFVLSSMLIKLDIQL